VNLAAQRQVGKQPRSEKSAGEQSLIEKSVSKAGFFTAPDQAMLRWSLLLSTLCVYCSVVQNSFVNFDDDLYFSTPEIRQAFDWNLLRWAFTTFAQANWHPITWLSHALDYQLFRSNPVAVHVESVLIHAASAIVLFLLLQEASGSVWRSVTVAAMFALHPLNVESVVWGSERKSVLSMLFFMIALWAYGRYAKQRSIGRYLGVIAAFALGLMAKPQIVTFPFVLLLWDVWPLGRWRITHGSGLRARSALGWLVAEKVPLFLLSAGSCVLTFRAQLAGGTVVGLKDLPFKLRVGNAVVAYVRYLGKAIWPSNLAVFYPYPAGGRSGWQIALATVLLLAISALVLAARKHRYLAVGWLWFLGTLVPMIGLVQVAWAAMADRYAYLPFIGLFLMVTWGVADWAEARRISETWLRLAAGAALLLLSVATCRQVGYWRDGETLWTHAVEVTVNNSLAQAYLGVELARKGRSDEAMEHFRQALTIYPEDPIANLHIGIYEGAHGNAGAAVEHLNKTVHFTNDPQMKESAYANLGTAYRNLHDYAHAEENFRSALSINPANLAAEVGMGLVAQHRKDFPGAIRWYSQAMLAQPSAIKCLLLAKAMEKNGQLEESKGVYDEARNLTSDLAASQRIVDQLLATVN
jgi:tetratricopeptide (TPR) repeat protein